MLEIGEKLPVRPSSNQTATVTKVVQPQKSVIQAGTIVLLSPDALKLSRDLHAVENDPEIDAMQRHDASVQLRQMAAEILTGKKG